MFSPSFTLHMTNEMTKKFDVKPISRIIHILNECIFYHVTNIVFSYCEAQGKGRA